MTGTHFGVSVPMATLDSTAKDQVNINSCLPAYQQIATVTHFCSSRCLQHVDLVFLVYQSKMLCSCAAMLYPFILWLVLDICTATTCQNGGTCHISDGYFYADGHYAYCYCPQGFSGQYCEITSKYYQFLFRQMLVLYGMFQNCAILQQFFLCALLCFSIMFSVQFQMPAMLLHATMAVLVRAMMGTTPIATVNEVSLGNTAKYQVNINSCYAKNLFRLKTTRNGSTATAQYTSQSNSQHCGLVRVDSSNNQYLM